MPTLINQHTHRSSAWRRSATCGGSSRKIAVLCFVFVFVERGPNHRVYIFGQGAGQAHVQGGAQIYTHLAAVRSSPMPPAVTPMSATRQ
jgi:hypothetical protein